MRKTKTMFRDLSPLWLLPAALLGCGSVEGAQAGIAIKDAPAEIAKAVCPKAYTCCMPAQLMGNDLAGTDEASCEMKTTSGFQTNLDAVVTSQKKGRVVYDGNKLQACVSHIRAATCAELNATNHFTGVPGCDSFVTPEVAVGEACSFDWECVGGWCARAPMATGDGACKAFVGLGASCGDTDKCGKDLTCDATSHACAAVTAPPAATPPAACFYSSACALAGDARPTLAGGLALTLALLAATRRRRRSRG